MPSSSDLLVTALRYAARGWPVLPLHTPQRPSGLCSCLDPACDTVGKHPRTKGGAHSGSVEAEKIRGWWSKWPEANVGIATGAGAGVFVLDVDPRNGGDDELDALQVRHGALPDTLTAETGGGGWHYFFAYPSEGLRTAKLSDGLDLKSNGGYVVAPPSLHASGEPYRWMDEGVLIAEAPAWLLQLARTKRDRGSAGSRTRVAARIPEGGRNNALTSHGGRLRQMGMEREEIVAALHAMNQQRCDPPLPDAEVDRIATSVARYEPGERGPRQRQERAERPIRAQADRKPSGPVLAPPTSIRALLDEPEPDERWIADGLIPAGGNVLVAAYPKTHKTNTCLDLALAAASATPFLQRYPVPTVHRVGIVLMEGSRWQLKRRMERMAAGRGLSLGSFEGMVHPWFRPACLKLSSRPVMEELGRYVAELQLDLLIVDNWTLVSSGDSDKADQVASQLSALSALRDRRPGLTVVLVHHARKVNGERGGSRLTDEVRNSGAFGQWYDTGLILSRHGGDADVIQVKAEMRDIPDPPPFFFTVADEVPAGVDVGVEPRGWMRLIGADSAPRPPEEPGGATEATRSRTRDKVVDVLRESPGVSKRRMREMVGGKQANVLAAFDALCAEGLARYEEPVGKGQPGGCYLTSPAPLGGASRDAVGTQAGTTPVPGSRASPPLGGRTREPLPYPAAGGVGQ